MPGVQHLLRKAAIEKMSSPEQLDMAMRVTSPVSWLALVTLGLMVSAGVWWGIYGEITVRVDGEGLWLPGGGVQSVEASEGGRLVELTVSEGDRVREGQVIAVLDLPEVAREVEMAFRAVEDAEATLQSEQAAVQARLYNYDSDIRALQQQIERKQALYEKSRSVRKQDIEALQSQVRNLRNAKSQERSRLVPYQNRLNSAQAQYDKVEGRLEANREVRSRTSGQVAAINVEEGALIRAGQSLMNLENPDAAIEVVLYVPLEEGKKIKPGMVARLSPRQFKREEWGFVIAKVQSVSSQPVNPEQIVDTLENQSLAQRFSQGNPFRVIAIPEVDSESGSGFLWSSGRGPNEEIGANSPCEAQIVVDSKRPIEYVVPMLRKLTGIG